MLAEARVTVVIFKATERHHHSRPTYFFLVIIPNNVTSHRCADLPLRKKWERLNSAGRKSRLGLPTHYGPGLLLEQVGSLLCFLANVSHNTCWAFQILCQVVCQVLYVGFITYCSQDFSKKGPGTDPSFQKGRLQYKVTDQGQTIFKRQN